MIKREDKTSKYALVRNHLQHERIIQGTKSYLYVFKIIQKPMFLSMNRVRRLESKLFCFSITQDILVDTWKFTGSGEAWNNLYTDFQNQRDEPA